MPSRHLYTPLEGKAEGSNMSDFEEHLHPRMRTFNVSCIHVLVYAVLIIVSFVAGSLVHPIKGSSHSAQDVYGRDNQLRELNSFVPKFPNMIQQFDFNRTFMGEPGEEDTAAWVSQIPKGKGIVKLPNSKPFPDDTFNLSVFHQLHCLYTLRQSFWAFYRTTEGISISADKNATYMLLHGNHCFEYLRQAVSCNMDLTLEPFSVERGTFEVWGVKHQCTDFEKVREWVVSMRTSNVTSIVRWSYIGIMYEIAGPWYEKPHHNTIHEIQRSAQLLKQFQ